MKSVVLVPVPRDVVAVSFPDETADGTVKESAVVLDALDDAVTPFNATVVDDVLKFVPVTETLTPEAPLVGVKLVIVGAPAVVTVKVALLVTVLPPTVTLTGPVVAPVGTVVAIDPMSDAVTVAAVPLKATALFAGVVLNAAP